MTYKNVNYKQLKIDVLNEHNKLRADPKSFIPHLENHLKYFKGDVYTRPGEIGIQTNEGKAAVNEAINYLKKAKPLGKIELNDDLCKAVEDHVNDIGPSGECGHDGSDGSSPSDRVERYCIWEGEVCENIDFGSKTGLDIIISLLIDDGGVSRGHRKNLFNEKIKLGGVAVGPHAEYGICCVCVYCEGISGKKGGIKSSIKSSPQRAKGQPDLTQELANVKLNENGKNKLIGLFDKLDQKAVQRKEELAGEEYDMDNDPDFPEGAINVDIKIKEKVEKGKKIVITKKTYTLEDGSKQTVEIQSFTK